MTHNDIYTKFMIEYDKANVTSSYPSLTEYEVATVLDKAYLALIAQKVTGNNPRRAPFESDTKSIADIQPLVIHTEETLYNDLHAPAANITQFRLPKDCLYVVSTMLNANLLGDDSTGDEGHLKETRVYAPEDIGFQQLDPDIWVNWNETYSDNLSRDYVEESDVYGDSDGSSNTQSSGNTQSNNMFKIKGNPMDKLFYRYVPVKLVTHEVAEKFFLTPYNMPWVKIPVSYVENNIVHIVYDSIKMPNVSAGGAVHFTYVKKPNTFVKDLNNSDFVTVKDSVSYFECPTSANEDVKKHYIFECSDTIAEEVINLAISFALENVESQRLNSKLNMRGLEA